MPASSDGRSLDGETLETCLERGPVDAPGCLCCRCRFARGLARVHQAGIVHGDVKPGNIDGARPSGEAKLLDFGIGEDHRAACDPTWDGALVTSLGTIASMAPEHVRCSSPATSERRVAARRRALRDAAGVARSGADDYELLQGRLSISL